MKKTILFACLVTLSACHHSVTHDNSDTKLQEVLVEVELPSQPAPIATSPALHDIVTTTKQMNDTIENCIGPALGLNFKTQTCEAPTSVCH